MRGKISKLIGFKQVDLYLIKWKVADRLTKKVKSHDDWPSFHWSGVVW